MGQLNNMVAYLNELQGKFDTLYFVVLILAVLNVIQFFMVMWSLAQNSGLREQLIKMEGYYVGRSMERNRSNGDSDS